MVRISGRANFSSSIEFKTVINELYTRNFRHFVLDLTECVTMDSTFLGVLAGFALRADDSGVAQGNFKMELLNPNDRVVDLLENLGVVHLFTVVKNERPVEADFKPVNPTNEASHRDISLNCLEAHQTLMAANPQNIPKFKEVTQFLAEDLKKLDGQ